MFVRISDTCSSFAFLGSLTEWTVRPVQFFGELAVNRFDGLQQVGKRFAAPTAFAATRHFSFAPRLYSLGHGLAFLAKDNNVAAFVFVFLKLFI